MVAPLPEILQRQRAHLLVARQHVDLIVCAVGRHPHLGVPPELGQHLPRRLHARQDQPVDVARKHDLRQPIRPAAGTEDQIHPLGRGRCRHPLKHHEPRSRLLSDQATVELHVSDRQRTLGPTTSAAPHRLGQGVLQPTCRVEHRLDVGRLHTGPLVQNTRNSGFGDTADLGNT